jgi:hypothetical protein
MRRRVVEERHGSPGALRAPGGVGGHVGAPHEVVREDKRPALLNVICKKP